MICTVLGDAIEEMEKLVSRGVTVDAVITDPPYNIARKNNFSTMKNKYGKPVHRRGIDFGEWDKGFDLLSWMDIAIQLIKPDGSLFFFNDWKNIGEMAMYAEAKGMAIKDCFRWEKANPMPRNRDRRYITDFELGVWLVKRGGKWTFNRSDRNYERPKFVAGIVSGSEKTEHTTQKPVALMEHLIKIHTNYGDTVLDPFMGSGTTGLACNNLQRNFIGIENNKKYYLIARNRVRQPRLLGFDNKGGVPMT